MGSKVSTLEIPEKPDRVQNLLDLENHSYTKIPNVWLDEIRYRFNKNVCNIVECIIRQTIGYHKNTAEITTQEFADYAGVGTTVANEAKKEAMEIGIVVLIRRGTGGKTSEYGINLDYKGDLAEIIKRQNTAQ